MTTLDTDLLRAHVAGLWPRFKFPMELVAVWVEQLSKFEFDEVRSELSRQRRVHMNARDPDFRAVKAELWRRRLASGSKDAPRCASYAMFCRLREKWPLAAELCARFDTGAIDTERLERWDEAVQTVNSFNGAQQRGLMLTTLAYIRRMVERLVPCGIETQTWRDQVLGKLGVEDERAGAARETLY